MFSELFTARRKERASGKECPAMVCVCVSVCVCVMCVCVCLCVLCVCVCVTLCVLCVCVICVSVCDTYRVFEAETVYSNAYLSFQLLYCYS